MSYTLIRQYSFGYWGLIVEIHIPPKPFLSDLILFDKNIKIYSEPLKLIEMENIQSFHSHKISLKKDKQLTSSGTFLWIDAIESRSLSKAVQKAVVLLSSRMGHLSACLPNKLPTSGRLRTSSPRFKSPSHNNMECFLKEKSSATWATISYMAWFKFEHNRGTSRSKNRRL